MKKQSPDEKVLKKLFNHLFGIKPEIKKPTKNIGWIKWKK